MKNLSRFNEGSGSDWASSNRLGGGKDIYQEVEVYLTVFGDYCAFHEMSLNIAYDVTNDIQLNDDYSLEELQNWDDHESDVQLVGAIKIGDKYYIDIDSI